MSRFARYLLYTAAALGVWATCADAQLLGGVGLPQAALPVPISTVPVAGPVLQGVLGASELQQRVVKPTLDGVAGLPTAIAQSGSASLADLRRMRLQELIRENSAVLEADEHGAPVRRGILIAIDPAPLSLQGALRAGFAVLGADNEQSLGLSFVKLAVPKGMSVRQAKNRLHVAAPDLEVDYDHVFEPAGGSLTPAPGALASFAGAGRGRVLGMIDGGVASHPALAGSSIEQRGFSGMPKPTGHGTAVASLLVGNQGPFHGAANGAQLFVADVYGGSSAAGSASAIVQALGWLATHRPQVINISLVGPPNAVVARAIGAVQQRGIRVVAAVGNDGPAAPPQFPASYTGVIAVTAVDAKGRALPEAGKALHLDFAAPGADMAAALPGQGFARVRGTSFAAPLAAARLALDGSPERLAAEARKGSGRVGRGIVCSDCRVDPRMVGVK
ncbi:MAG TPA: S8 family serine peptidase [Sphingomicrobium sp.]|nr:S8 family serine peptidase [Sphingomicrobium sp.]